MGLDWVAFSHDEESGKWIQTDSFRGKGVTYDKNIEGLSVEVMTNIYNDLDNLCYGIENHDHKDISGLPYMPRNWKWLLITEIKKLIEKDEKDIILEWDDEERRQEDYEDWLDFMQRAVEFLEDAERVFCWY